MGWLEKLTDWFKDAAHAIFDAFQHFMHDMVLFSFKTGTMVVVWILENIPVPDFLSSYSICALLNNAGPIFGWIYGTLRIGECMTILAAGYAFRFTRKALTLFQW